MTIAHGPVYTRTCQWCHSHGLRGHADAEDCTCVDDCGYTHCGQHGICTACRRGQHRDCWGDDCGCWCGR